MTPRVAVIRLTAGSHELASSGAFLFVRSRLFNLQKIVTRFDLPLLSLASCKALLVQVFSSQVCPDAVCSNFQARVKRDETMGKKSRISPEAPSVDSSFSDASSSSISSADQPSNHFKLYFENLTYIVRQRSLLTARLKEKVVFNDLTGSMVSSSLVGIMGPSGAGKSTFLECLANRRIRGRSGAISLKFDNSEKRKAKISFIPQKDALQESLTVRECILFASKLQNSARKHTDKNYLDSVVATTVATALAPTEGSKSAAKIRRMTISSDGFHEAVAEQMIKLLALGNCADTIVKNISGGQQKRLSIAQELCSKPNILILGRFPP